MKRLEFIGKDVARRNQLELLDAIRAQFPNLSEAGIQEMAKAELTRIAPRHKRYVQHLLGEDILTADVTTIPAWPHMTSFMRGLVQRTPLARRRELVDPAGMQRTYVWCHRNGWVQEVSDHDVDLIRASGAVNWFRDADAFGPYQPARAFDFPVIDRMTFANVREAKRFEEEALTRTPQWPGA